MVEVKFKVEGMVEGVEEVWSGEIFGEVSGWELMNRVRGKFFFYF